MHFSTLVAALALASVAESKLSFMDSNWANQSPAHPTNQTMNDTAHLKHQAPARRLLCGLLGLFCGTDYSSDVNNCGVAGNRCSTSWANGSGAKCLNGVCGANSCNSGYAFSWTAGRCVNLANDVANCGAVDNACNVPFSLSNTCTAGVCKAASCLAGYALGGGVCTKIIDTMTDMNNCGGLGTAFKCPSSYSNGYGSVCVSGICQPSSCNLGYGFDFSSKTCKNIYSDINNCGKIGSVCQFPHGSGTCLSGVCVLTGCNPGYWNIFGTCTSFQLDCDRDNCGAVGASCQFLNGDGICENSACKYTSCAAGYALLNNKCTAVDTRSDVNNCGKIGNKCQSTYINGGVGQCVNGLCFSSCGSGYTWDPTYLFCRQTGSDLANCGDIGKVCNPDSSLGAMCSGGSCFATACVLGYKLVNGACVKVDLTSDVNNCGLLGRACNFLPAGATGICSNSQCKITACPTKYALTTAGTCIAATVSQRARVKKSKIIVPTLCPKGETACPIANSASFDLAVNHHFSAPANEYSGIMSGDGGYECLDVRQSLESCGGCASTGEGQDCTKIPHSAGVGCDAGLCSVFSCTAGFHPNLAGTRCVKAAHASARNASRGAGRRRHLASGHGHGHHGAIHS